MSDRAQARRAKEHLAEHLADHADPADIVGIGLSRAGDGYCIKVNVRTAPAADQVPASVDGVEVRVAVVGDIHAQ